MINQPHMVFFGHPWSGGLQWKLDALRYRQMNTFISVARDRDTGRVYPHPEDGRPVIDYTPSAFDRAHILAGQVAIAKLCFIQGATEIWPFVHGVPPFVRRRKPGPNSATASAAAGEEGNNNTPNPKKTTTKILTATIMKKKKTTTKKKSTKASTTRTSRRGSGSSRRPTTGRRRRASAARTRWGRAG